MKIWCCTATKCSQTIHVVWSTTQVKDDGSMEPYYKETDVVGKKISTKSVGSNERSDITDLYKYDEGKEIVLFKFCNVHILHL